LQRAGSRSIVPAAVFDILAFAFGVGIGALGTMVGVGGGFLIVPVVALVEPSWSPRTVTAFSLAVVCANSCSGTVAYVRQRRVDLRSAALFAVAAIPGVGLGVLGADRVDRGWFDTMFGGVLAAMALWLAVAPGQHRFGIGGASRRTLVTAAGERYGWSFDMRVGIAGSVLVGIVSALFGIGGGPIQVPFLVSLLNYPEHVATATSHAVLAVTSLVATVLHVVQGDYSRDDVVTLCTAAGALAGAPIGARLSRRIPGKALVRILAAMLAFIACRLLFWHGGDAPRSSTP
jgi:uncharacterized membrane protein YfcA